MGKVYIKTKYDNGMKMDIPHSYNMANAMYGFREMGAEIIPYHLIDEIYAEVQRGDIVLDYIDQCNQMFSKFGVTPHMPDYPEVLKPFLGMLDFMEDFFGKTKSLVSIDVCSNMFDTGKYRKIIKRFISSIVKLSMSNQKYEGW